MRKREKKKALWSNREEDSEYGQMKGSATHTQGRKRESQACESTNSVEGGKVFFFSFSRGLSVVLCSCGRPPAKGMYLGSVTGATVDGGQPARGTRYGTH